MIRRSLDELNKYLDAKAKGVTVICFGGTESIYVVRNTSTHTLNFIRHLNEK